MDSKRIEYGVYKSALAEGRSLAMEEINTILEEERRQKEEAKKEEMKMLSMTVQILHENGMNIQQIAEKLKRPEEDVREILEK